MFYLKRIKELEAKVADLKKMTHEMSHIVQTQSKVINDLSVLIVPEKGEGLVENAKSVNSLLQDLVDFDNIVNLDDGHFAEALERRSEYEREFLLSMKNEYEKRLKKFILKCNQQTRKPRRNNGKETPKASE